MEGKEEQARQKDSISEDKLQSVMLGACGESTSGASSKKFTGKDNLEDLFSTLRQQISTSDWLEKNTSDKWVKENPELAQEYMEAAKKS